MGLSWLNSKTLVTGLVVASVVILVNYLSLKVNKTFDLTEEKAYSLSPGTVKVLETLKKPVQVHCFFRSDDPRRGLAKDFLERYANHSDLLSYEFHNPDTHLGLLKKYGVHNYGMVFVSGAERRQVHQVNELELTRGIIAVSNHTANVDEIKKHLERSLRVSNHKIFLTPLQMFVVLFTVLIALPLIFCLIGVTVWWKQQ